MNLEISIQDFHKQLQGLSPAPDSNPDPLCLPGQLCLLDIREPWEAEICVLPGSRLIPMGDLPSRAQQELDRGAHIVVICHHGNRSLGVTVWLREQGFEKAQSLAGGLEDWARIVDPSMDRY